MARPGCRARQWGWPRPHAMPGAQARSRGGNAASMCILKLAQPGFGVHARVPAPQRAGCDWYGGTSKSAPAAHWWRGTRLHDGARRAHGEVGQWSYACAHAPTRPTKRVHQVGLLEERAGRCERHPGWHYSGRRCGEPALRRLPLECGQLHAVRRASADPCGSVAGGPVCGPRYHTCGPRCAAWERPGAADGRALNGTQLFMSYMSC